MSSPVNRLGLAALLLSAPGVALAQVNQVPEPGVLELVALAAVVGFIARKRRK